MPKPANRTKNRPLPPVETRFKPGQSGNPTGRPKSAHLSAAYRQILEQPFPRDRDGRTWAQVIAQRLADAAAKGDVQAAREMADRVEGKAVAVLEGSIGLQRLPEGVSEEEAEAVAKNPSGFLAAHIAAEVLLVAGDPDNDYEHVQIIPGLLRSEKVRQGLRILIERLESKERALLTTALPEDPVG